MINHVFVTGSLVDVGPQENAKGRRRAGRMGPASDTLSHFPVGLQQVSLLAGYHSYILTNSQCDQLLDGLIAQHCTGIAEVMGLNPVQA